MAYVGGLPPRFIAVVFTVVLLCGAVTGPAATPSIRFKEVAASSGLRFELRNGASGEFHQIELTGGVTLVRE